MYYGWPSLCLNVADLEPSTRFYEALGMEVLPEESAPGGRVVLRSGGFRLGLIAGIGSNVINYRGADVFAAFEALSAQLPGLAGEPERYTPSAENRADAPGACWFTEDPDGNGVFFDTNENEQGEAFREMQRRRILTDAAQALASIGETDCLAALQAQVIDPFCGGD